jgi:hypothetical protein
VAAVVEAVPAQTAAAERLAKVLREAVEIAGNGPVTAAAVLVALVALLLAVPAVPLVAPGARVLLAQSAAPPRLGLAAAAVVTLTRPAAAGLE